MIARACIPRAGRQIGQSSRRQVANCRASTLQSEVDPYRLSAFSSCRRTANIYPKRVGCCLVVHCRVGIAVKDRLAATCRGGVAEGNIVQGGVRNPTRAAAEANSSVMNGNTRCARNSIRYIITKVLLQWL